MEAGAKDTDVASYESGCLAFEQPATVDRAGDR